MTMPRGACDCHVHVFGPFDRFPTDPAAPYRPAAAPLSALQAAHRAAGIDRVVVVQPSVYRTDNACAAAALERLGPSARGVAVVAPDASPETLSRLHRAGFRGVRVNFGAAGQRDPAIVSTRVLAAAEQVGELGWHVQVFAPLAALAGLREVAADLPAPLVIDHFGFPDASAGSPSAAIRALVPLVETGRVHVKLSGAYLFCAAPDWSDATPLAQALVSTDPSRLLWGSNWPHPGGGTGVPGQAHERHPDAVDERVALERLADWVGGQEVQDRILVHNPAALYGFEG